jgi:hypothetical protein
MEIETLVESFHSLNAGSAGPYHSKFYDLPVLIGNMKRSQAWTDGDLKNIVLLNRPGKQILLTALHDKTEIESFQASDSLSFQMIEGELWFRTKTESLILKKGQLLTLHEKVNYSLTTNEETVFLLTILNHTAKAAES